MLILADFGNLVYLLFDLICPSVGGLVGRSVGLFCHNCLKRREVTLAPIGSLDLIYLIYPSNLEEGDLSPAEERRAVLALNGRYHAKRDYRGGGDSVQDFHATAVGLGRGLRGSSVDSVRDWRDAVVGSVQGFRGAVFGSVRGLRVAGVGSVRGWLAVAAAGSIWDKHCLGMLIGQVQSLVKNICTKSNV